MSQPQSHNNAPLRREVPPGHPVERAWRVYVAAALGAMAAAVADAVGSAEGTVARLVVALPGQLQTSFTPLVMIFLVIPLGGFALSWVYRPFTRMDGFARGLALFAILGLPADRAAAPDPADPDITVSQIDDLGRSVLVHLASLFWIREARAQEAVDEDRTFTALPVTAEDPDAGRRLIYLVLIFEESPGGARGDSTAGPKATIAVRDAASGKTFIRRVVGKRFDIAAPPGVYSILVEVDGYRRSEATFEVRPQVEPEGTEYRLTMRRSSIPVGIQRLYPVQTVDLVGRRAQPSE